jgi:hypothetical protein
MTLSPTNKLALEAEHTARVYFIYLDLANDPLRACTGTRTYTTLGYDWLGIGEIGGLGNIVEAVDVSARPMSFGLSGVDPWIVEPLLSRVNYKNRDAKIYMGILLPDDELLDEPDLVWSGRMDVGSVTYDKNLAACLLVCEPDSARLLRNNVSRYSNADHQLYYPGDKFYEFITEISQKDLTWGGRSYGGTSSGGGGGGGSSNVRYRQK